MSSFQIDISIGRAVSFRGIIAFALAVLFCLSAGGARAQTEPAATGTGASYVTPFPSGDIYQMQVWGDGAAQDLADGLADTFSKTDPVTVSRKARVIGSLLRSEYLDDIHTEEQSRDPFTLGVITMGVNDRGSVRTNGSRAANFGTQGWREQYGQRIDALLKALKRRGIALYVVGVAPLRRADGNAEAQIVNEVLLDRSLSNGVKFIDVTESLTDESGAYTQFGLDATGNRNKLRDGDGVGLTQFGIRKVAALVATEVRRDLASARAERSLPLAGSEAEQRRINPERAAEKPVLAMPIPKTATSGTTPSRAVAAGAVPTAPAAPAAVGAGLKAETTKLSLRFPSLSGRDETNVPVDLVRPAVPQAVITLLTRKEAVESEQQPFDLLLDDVGGGASVATLVTSSADGPVNGTNRRRGANTQAAYNTVWVRGERLEFKAGARR